MEIKRADISDIPETLELHYRYQVDSIAPEDRADGFVTTPFTPEELRSLVEEEQGLFIARDAAGVHGYAMAASWAFWSPWPLFAHMIQNLGQTTFLGQTLDTRNSFQYGPACVDKAHRGQGLFPRLFEFMRRELAGQYPILVTFINQINSRSLAAHTRKLGLEVSREFDFNGNSYFELVYDMSRPVSGVQGG
ncbi:MAG: hypothetical protein MI747_09220 [Desulfobacterales bacterium]|nr:hypothetical protein [Desulfobacterales bacterium]